MPGSLWAQAVSEGGLPGSPGDPDTEGKAPPYLWCLHPQWWYWYSLKIPAKENTRGGEACLPSRRPHGRFGAAPAA